MEKPSKKNFVNLHVHSDYSLLDGLAKIDQLIEKAKELGMPALALTDHGVMYGAIEFYKKAREAGIKPIIGVESYISVRRMTDKQPKIDSKYFHMVLLAKNREGYENLIKITSAGHLEGFYYKPRVDKDFLSRHSKDLIGLSGCLAGEIPRAIIAGDAAKAKQSANEYIEIFGRDNFFFELQDHPKLEAQNIVNTNIRQLAREFKMPLVATADTHYVNPEDKVAHEVLLAVQSNSDDEDKKWTMEETDLYFRSAEEMYTSFADVPEAVENTLKVAEKCSLEIEFYKNLLPHFPIPKGKDEQDFLREQCLVGLKKRYGKITTEIEKRINFELETINKMGFASYFLIVADFINFAKQKGIMVGPGRGSAAGSLVAFALGITELDPLRYNLLFERFLNPDRISMPDIDSDFADNRRAEVIGYIRQKYGDDHVAGIITFGTMAARAAVRDTGRAIGMSYQDVDRVAKVVPPPVQGKNISLSISIKESPELREMHNESEQNKNLLDLAARLEGTYRHASQHASAIVISREALTHYVPLQTAQKGDVAHVTQYSMYPVDELGLLKMDILGLKNLTIIQNALRVIRAVYGEKIDILKIPLDDEKTYQLLGRGETVGVFQLESAGMQRYIKELKPTNLEDITAMVSLYRPGPLQFIDSFINRKHGREPIEYLHPLMENALKTTYGIPVYQEQVMQIAKDLAGFTGGEADTLRKAMGKKIAKLMGEMRVKFIEGAVKNKIAREKAQEIFSRLEDFAAYGFNKSHGASYAMIAYQTAYLKAHYPNAFMAALLTSDYNDLDRIGIEIEECERMGIKVLPPDVNESFVEFGVVGKNIRFGLAAIKNVGEGVAEKIVEERKKNEPYKNFEDFIVRLGPDVINKKNLESLAKAGATDSLIERNQILENMEMILKFSTGLRKTAAAGQIGLFGAGQTIAASTLSLPKAEPADKNKRLAWEKELLGIYLSEHPLRDKEKILKKYTYPIGILSENLVGQKLMIGGIVTQAKKITTRTKEPMLFATLEDLTGTIEAVVFPGVLRREADLWNVDKLLLIEGKMNIKDGILKFLADKAYPAGTDEDLAKIPIGFSPKILNLTIPRGIKKEILGEIKKILEQFPGDLAVELTVPHNGMEQKIKTKTKIEPKKELIEKLKNLLGEENIRI